MSDRAVMVKICGVRTLEGAQAAVDAGADLIGFICYPPARRYVAPEQIAAILAGVRGRSSVRAVGIFVNQAVDTMNAVAKECDLDLIQLSGDDDDEVVSVLDRPVIRAWRVGGSLSGSEGPSLWLRHLSPNPGGEPGLNDGSPSPPGNSVRFQGSHQQSKDVPLPQAWGRGQERGPAAPANLFATLLEPPVAGWGGAGQPWDWSVARSVTELPSRPPVFLAGGLQPENVAGAIAAVLPDGVDVSSGVEINGVQDCARIAAFVAAAKGAMVR